MGFELDSTGDVLIEGGVIGIVSGDNLLQQKVKTVLQTNLGEWFFNINQGVDFDNLLGKNTNAELVRYEIERGLAQVDSSFEITEFAYSFDRAARKATATFKARTTNGETVGGEYSWV